MLLVAGGQHDHNIGWLLRRVLARKIAFVDVINGPDLRPDLALDLDDGTLRLDGKIIRPTGVFQRHDVFLDAYENKSEAQAAALNWFYFIRGWACANPAVRCLNRRSGTGENNKIQNLIAARDAGLRIPSTRVQCLAPKKRGHIRKPVAGGELTEMAGAADPAERWRPYFHQPKLLRPELRVFVVDKRVFGCELKSENVDYRNDPHVRLAPAAVPRDVAKGLLRLCRALELDFAAADFMRDAQGRLHFLEINTQPMFVAFDKTLDGVISDAIIDYLTG